MTTLRLCGTLLLCTALLTACDVSDNGDKNSKVLGTVHIAPGEHAQNAQTVNGSIDVGENAVVDHAETVNGNVTLHPHSTASSVETVNGSVRLEDGVHVTGAVELVNGHIELNKGADVAGQLSNVNGTIEVQGAHVGGGIESVTGNITIGADSRIEGGIHIHRRNDGISFGTPKIPRIVIGPGATVEGPMIFEREVRLYVSDRATIGAVQGATPTKFSGDQP
jgi:hypothetical protein